MRTPLRRGSECVEYVRGTEVGSLYLEDSMIDRTQGRGLAATANARRLLPLLVSGTSR
jgi:hypothetical protein